MPHPVTIATIAVAGGVTAMVTYLAVAVRQLATLDAVESGAPVLARRAGH